MASKEARERAIREATDIVRRSGLRTGVPMGQREDVTASLLASHGVDAVARRKVAEDVKTVVANALPMGMATERSAAVQAMTAASAVVLASDLRAPSDDPAEMERQMHPAILLHPDGRTEMAQPHMCPDWRVRLANVERLLAKHFDGDDLAYQDGLDDSLRDALAEVRSLLGGE